MRVLRTLGFVAVTAAVAMAVTPIVQRQLAAVKRANPELRSPLIYFPFSVNNLFTAKMTRLPISSGVREGVTATRRTVAASGDDLPADIVMYEPRERVLPSAAVLWIHGGGLVGGSTSPGDAFCSELATELAVPVISVEYRLAPEHPYPGAIDDCFTALRWLHAHGEEYGVDPQRIAVGGESAGGGLAAALAQRAYDNDVPLCFQLLIYPMLDDRTVERAEREGIWTLVWSPVSNRYGWTSYLGQAPQAEEHRPYAVPARRDDLSGLAPAWIAVGDIDLFHDEDVHYARRLQDAGVPVELHVEPGMYHGADSAMARRPSIVAFRARMMAALRSAIA